MGSFHMYIWGLHRGVEQLVARRAHNPKVGGSNPPPATIQRLLSVTREPFFVLVIYLELTARRVHIPTAVGSEVFPVPWPRY